MSVRKREWTTRAGERRQAWVVDYVSQDGTRHIKTFDRKKDADAYHATVNVEVATGMHTPASQSITLAEAAEQWLAFVQLEGRERSTIAQYRQHVNLHIVPRMGREKLAKLSTPRINVFKDQLLRDLSRPMARKVLTSLKSLLKDAKRRGNVAQNVASDVSIGGDKRGNGKLKMGVDIPTPDEIRAILAAAQGRWRPLLVTAVFSGLRSSELRGLRWSDVDLKRGEQGGELHVRQRADCYRAIGSPKSHGSTRTIPLGPLVVNTLREWRLACPKGPLDLVFPTDSGTVQDHANIVQRGWWPAQVRAGVVSQVDGKPVPKYSGLHCTRHFFASWCINREQDGGLGLPIKTVQTLLGHSSIVLTSDVYGHLFPRRDDGGELARAERALLGLIR